MMTVKEIMRRVRQSTNDTQETGYSDEDLLGYINDGIRFLRRTIIQMLPELISEIEEGQIPQGERQITTATLFSKIIEVKVGDTVLYPILRRQSNSDKGKPRAYCLAGFNKIELYPTPDNDFDFSVVYVPDMVLLTIDDVSPFPTDLDDFVIEYAVIRASIRNEFDISQESQVFANLTAQAEGIISGIRTTSATIENYWDKATERNDVDGGYW